MEENSDLNFYEVVFICPDILKFVEWHNLFRNIYFFRIRFKNLEDINPKYSFFLYLTFCCWSNTLKVIARIRNPHSENPRINPLFGGYSKESESDSKNLRNAIPSHNKKRNYKISKKKGFP